MGVDSSRNSGSFQKGLLKRVLGVDQNRDAVPIVKQRHPVFSVSNGDSFSPPGRTAKPAEAATLQASKQINKDGFVVYNINENDDVYISIESETAYFEENEPEVMKMTSGRFVGGQRQARAEPAAPAIPVEEIAGHSQAADLFTNAIRKDSFDEIDFNEIIIKESDEFCEADMIGADRAICAPAPAQQTAYTSSAAAAPIFSGEITGYTEESDYEVVSDAAPVYAAPAIVAEPVRVPEKTVEQKRFDDIMAKIKRSSGAKPAVQSHSVFSTPKDEAPVVSSDAAPASGAVTIEPESAKIPETKVETCPAGFSAPVYAAPAPVYATPASVGPISGSATIADVPNIVVGDTVADILMLTLPELRIVNELEREYEAHYPDDNLESYDDMFIFT
jgi:hypothetical protein